MNPYSSYKESGVKWIGKIPDDWTTNKIKYLTDGKKDSFIDGDWIESTNISESGIRYITTGNIGEGVYKEQGKGYISEETFVKLDCTEVFSGDLVISRLSPPVGRSCIIPNLQTRIVTSVDNVILRPKKDIEKSFLNFIFNSQGYYSHTDLISRGTTLTRISRTMLGNNKIVLPPLQEQQQISNYLDHKTQHIDSLIEKTQQKIELLKEQRTSLINQVVTKGLNPDVEMKDSGVEWIGKIPSGWDVVSIKRLCYVKRGSSPRPIDDPKYFDEQGEFRWVRISDVSSSERYLEKTTQVLSELGSSLSTKRYPGDIFLSIAGSVGKPIISKIKCCIHDGFVWFDDLNIDSEYLYYIFSLGQCFQGLGKFGTQLNLNTETVGSIKITLMTHFEQQQIVDHLDKETSKIDSTIEKETQRIELLKEYRQSLISEVVTGKVDIRDEVVV